MRGVNKVTILGRVGRKPDFKETVSGKKVAFLSVATNREWKNREGVKQTATDWHSITLYDLLADIVLSYVNTGSEIYIEGNLRYSQYDKNGVTHYVTSIVADNVQLIGGKDRGGSEANKPQVVYSSQHDEVPF